MNIDINCDMGESHGNNTFGNDIAIFPFITSCNIACGFHGGDPQTIENTIKLAIKHNVQIGAHPSFPDLEGFGRRSMDIEANELMSIIKYQVAAIKGIAESLDTGISYVKPHGALYNLMSIDPSTARSVVLAIKAIDSSLSVMGLAGSLVKDIVDECGLSFIAEAFADRRYEPSGELVSRKNEGAIIHDPLKALEQVLSIVENERVKVSNGLFIPMKADSICIHGDNPAALEILKALDFAFHTKGIIKKRFK